MIARPTEVNGRGGKVHASNAAALRHLKQQLRPVLEPDIKCACARSPLPALHFRLLPGEELSEQIAERRWTEYRLGRFCARAAMEQLGMTNVSVPAGASGEPCWPAGFVGSISHSEGLAAAIAASKTNYAALGLDIIVVTFMDVDIAPVICTRGELLTLRRGGRRPQDALAIFAAKEAVFKAAWPFVRRVVDFREVELERDSNGPRITFRVVGGSLPAEVATNVRCRVASCGDLVIAVALIRAPQVDAPIPTREVLV